MKLRHTQRQLQNLTKDDIIQDEAYFKPDATSTSEQPEQEILFKPNPGPQTEFLAAPEREVLYGGAAGGGKTYSLIIDP